MTSTPRAPRPSIVDVASLAGVSVGTVSNVLNRPDRVAQVTLERVQEAIKELDFVPNSSARQLRVGKVPTIGAIVLDIRNPFFTDVARGVEDELDQHSHTLMLASSDDDPAREERFVRLFEEHGVAGILAVPASPALADLRAAAQRGMRVVLLDSQDPEHKISSVTVDNVAGGRLAAQHLLSLGYQKITMLNGPHTMPQCRDRAQGVREALIDAGLEVAAVFQEISLDALNASAAAQAFETALGRATDADFPMALFCVNDLVAVGVQRTLRNKFPGRLHQVAIVGYDDIEIAAELATPLTSVRQPTHEIGQRAATLLLSDSEEAEEIVFQPELVVRETSIPAHDHAAQ